MSKQQRPTNAPKVMPRSGPSYAELKTENDELRKSLLVYIEQTTQYKAIAEKYHTALSAVNVLVANSSFIILQTLAAALPPALLTALAQQAMQLESTHGNTPPQAPRGNSPPKASSRRGVVGSDPGGLVEAPVFTGVPTDGPSDVSLTGETPDEDDDDDIDPDKI